MFRRLGGLSQVHFVGIGGSGMSGIAEVLLEHDLVVSGSDQAQSEATERLASLGANIFIGHRAEQIEGAEIVVVSSAVPRDNPEVAEARDRGIAVVGRAEMLAELMRLKYGVAVAGTHGKTTTTSLVGTVLTDAGLDPTVIVGGRLRVSGTGARMGHSDYLVAEADEFDRSFLRLAPILAVITNIDADHLDTYRDLDEVKDAFVQFAGGVPFFGQVIACLDDPNVQQILPRLADRRIVTYGFSAQADYAAVGVSAEGWGSRFTVRHVVDGDLGEIVLPMPGKHNIQNALATVVMARALDVDFKAVASSLAGFDGVHRRFEHLGSWRDATIVDDYAHHPTEVTATLSAAKQVFSEARVHAVFQPHLYSRTKDQADSFGRALLIADRAIVTDVYASRESPIDGVSGQLVVDAAKTYGHRQVSYCPRWQDAPELLAEDLRPGDAIVTLGAGDVYRLAAELASESASESASDQAPDPASETSTEGVAS